MRATGLRRRSTTNSVPACSTSSSRSENLRAAAVAVIRFSIRRTISDSLITSKAFASIDEVIADSEAALEGAERP